MNRLSNDRSTYRMGRDGRYRTCFRHVYMIPFLGLLVVLVAQGGCDGNADTQAGPDSSIQQSDGSSAVETTADATDEARTPVEQVEQVVLAFAESVACNNLRISETVPLVPLSSDKPDKKAKYLVFWRGSFECTNFPANFLATHAALVRARYDGGFFVDINGSEPVVDVERATMRGAGEAVEHTEDSVTFVGAAYADDDGMCCPSMKVRYKIEQQPSGDWKIVERNKYQPETSE